MKALRIVSVLSILMIGFHACGGGGGGGGPTGPGDDDPQTATSVILSPSSISLDALGATEQLSATVQDQNGATMPGASVTWSSGNPQVCTVSASGLVTAVSNGNAKITATSGSASASADATVAQEVHSLGLDVSAVTLVTGTRTRITAAPTDRLDNPVSVEVSWSSNDGSVAEARDGGIVVAIGEGGTQIVAAASDHSETVAVTVEPPAADVSSLETAEGTIELPSGVGPENVWVASALGGGASVAADGSFSFPAVGETNATIFAMNGEEILGVAVVTPSSEPDASSRAATGASLSINGMSTALALVKLSPFFAVAPDAITGELMELFAGLPEVQALAAIIADRQESIGHLPGPEDSELMEAIQDAQVAAYDAAAAIAGLSGGAELIAVFLQGATKGNGVELEWTPVTGTPTDGAELTLKVRNTRPRDADLYLVPANDQGQPAVDQADLGGAFGATDARVLRIPPANYNVNVTKLSTWIDIVSGGWGPTDPVPVTVPFASGSTRFLARAYGPGLLNGFQLSSEIEGDESWRWVWPSGRTFIFSYLVPVLKEALSVKLPGVSSSELAADIEAGSVLLKLFEKNLECFQRNTGPDAQMECAIVGSAGVIADSDFTTSLLMILLQHAAGQIGVQAVDQLTSAVPYVKIASMILTGANMLVVSGAIIASEARQDFDLSYNGILGASNLEVLGGDDQEAGAGQPLADPLLVRAVDAAGQAVPGAWVQWDVEEGGGTLGGSGVQATDEEGQAAVTWTLGASGEQRVRAMLAGEGGSEVFWQSGFPVPSRLEAVSGNVTGAAGAQVQVGARVLTSAGNPVSGHEVTFQVAAGQGSIAGSASATVSTGSDGVAEVGWTLPDEEGTYTASASAVDEGGSLLEGSPVTFSATVVDTRWKLAYLEQTPPMNPRLMIKNGNETSSPITQRVPHLRYSWSPDGDAIAYSAGSYGDMDVYIVNPDGGGLVNLTENLDGDAYSPVWSPDGSHIAFVWVSHFAYSYDTEVFVVGRDGSGLRNLSQGETYGRDESPAWLPGGEIIMFNSHSRDPAGYYCVSLSGGSPVLCDLGIWHYGPPIWSPDGTKVAVEGTAPDAQSWALYTLSSGGSDLELIIAGNDPELLPYTKGLRDVAWSLDNQWLGLTVSYGSGTPDVFAVHPDGSDLQGFELYLPALLGWGWAPGSRGMIFSINGFGGKDLWLLDTETGDFEGFLETSGAAEYSPSFAPGG